MADKTTETEEISRKAVADRLETLASELRNEDEAEVHVGNKTIQLSPSSAITYEIAVEERSPMIGSDVEAISLEVRWNPETDED